MKVIVVLRLAERNNAQILIDSDHYTTCMTDNPHFGAAFIVEDVAKCKIAIVNLRSALNAPKSEVKTDIIRIARDVLNRNLNILKNRVEQVANDASIPDTKRVEIVHSAGMKVKNQVHRGRMRFTVANTAVSGTVHLTAQGKANAHQWQYTNDIVNFTNRIAVSSTSAANTRISKLKKGEEYAFFHKSIVPKVNHDWEGPILLMVM